MDECTRVFVYGTLRKHESNGRLLRHAISVALQCSTPGDLFDTGEGYPALVEGSGKVWGELYDVTPRQLASLDQLEGYQPGGQDNLYERVRRTVMTDQGPMEADVYMWARNPSELRQKIPDGDWKNHRYLSPLQNRQQEEMIYFAYGSMMDDERFKSRKKECHFQHVLGRGVLHGYDLRFTRKSSDGGRADVMEVGGRIEGKLYRIGPEALSYLYEREGVRIGAYRPTWVDVRHHHKTLRNVLTFVVVDKQVEIAPPIHYAVEIVRGAKTVVSRSYLKTLVRGWKDRFGEDYNLL